MRGAGNNMSLHALVALAAPLTIAPLSDLGVPDPPAWRVLLYMSADNELDDAAVANLAEIEKAEQLGRVSIAVQVDLSRPRPGRRNPQSDRGGRRGAWRLEVKRGLFGAGLREVEDLGDSDAADGETLREFVDWADRRLPARHTLLVLWGHGRGEAGLLQDRGSGRTMSVAEAARALGDTRSDVLAMDLCSMQTLGVARALAGRADFLVGSEVARPALGWPYAPLLDFLSREGTQPADVARWLVDHAGDRGGAFAGSALRADAVLPFDVAWTRAWQEAGTLATERMQRLDAAVAALPSMSRLAGTVDAGAALDLLADLVPAAARDARRSYESLVIRNHGDSPRRGATGLAVLRRSIVQPAGRGGACGLTRPRSPVATLGPGGRGNLLR